MFTIRHELSAWETGLYKASKVVFWGGLAGAIVALQSIVSNWHPLSPSGGAELVLVNALLVLVVGWVQAHQRIKQAIATSKLTPPAPLPADVPPVTPAV